MELRFIGGVYAGNIKPTPFLCLILKMLQIQPEKDIIVEFIKNEEFKYVRALGAFYLRLTAASVDCFKYLEPLYNDNRKLRRQKRDANYELVHMDEFIDELLRSDRVCDVILPRLQKRSILEENNELEPKVSALDDDLDEEVPSDNEVGVNAIAVEKVSNEAKSKDRQRSRSRDRERRERDRDRRRDKDRFDPKRDRELDTSYRSRDRGKNREYRGDDRQTTRYDDRDRYRDDRRRDRDRKRYWNFYT